MNYSELSEQANLSFNHAYPTPYEKANLRLLSKISNQLAYIIKNGVKVTQDKDETLEVFIRED